MHFLPAILALALLALRASATELMLAPPSQHMSTCKFLRIKYRTLATPCSRKKTRTDITVTVKLSPVRKKVKISTPCAKTKKDTRRKDKIVKCFETAFQSCLCLPASEKPACIDQKLDKCAKGFPIEVLFPKPVATPEP